ncbi:MAG: peptidylprolyl isomerase [Deltaproteobacteria bacterium]|nr:peptidylprolyl isomerase [Deltaproteobacteria bacterium]
MTKPIAPGDTISIHYTGKLEYGDVFDFSKKDAPLKFTVGTGQVIAGLDNAVVGMVPEEKKTVTILPQDGYGYREENQVADFPKANIPPDMEVEIGMRVNMLDQWGNAIPGVITDILDDAVKVDLNHPLAGQTLIFDIEIVETGLEPNCDCCSGNCGGCGE